MGSVSNQDPWASYDYSDCSQGLCSLYCLQWCHVLPPPPPYYTGYTQDEDSGIDFSPFIIAIIGILASVLLLVCYYIFISKYCMRRSNRDTGLEFNDYHTHVESRQGASTGLDETLINSITACKYNKGDGLVEGTECSVCLCEFQENENLRLLPKCNHAFHLPCIDKWLKSSSSCPLCRSNIATPESLSPQPLAAAQEAHPHPNVNTSGHEFQHRNYTILDEAVNTTTSHAIQPLRRSISMNSLCQERNSIADILHVTDDDGEIQVETPHVSIGVESSSYPGHEPNKSNDRKGVLHFVRNSSAIKRSISTGRFMLTRYGKDMNHII